MKRSPRVIALLSCACSTGAFAQATAPAGSDLQSSTPSSGPQSGVEEIVVTAQKRAESLQEVPIAITALSEAALEQRGITGLGDLNTSPVVGLSITPFAGDASLLLIETRGVSSIDAGQGTVEPGTGIYIDDVYVGRAQGLGSELADPQRIEVLRGPQGTLFGRNSQGGAVRIVTKKPTGVLGGDGKFVIGNYGRRRYEAHFNLPEVAGFSVKLDYLNDEHDSYTQNGAARLPRLDRQTGFGGVSGEGYRASVRWRPIDPLTVDYAYDHTKSSANQDYWHSQEPLGIRPLDSFNKRRKTSWVAAFHEPFATKGQSHTLTAAYDFSSEITLRSISGWRKTDVEGSASLMGAFAFIPFGGPVPIAAFEPGLGTTSLGLPDTTEVFAVSGVVAAIDLNQSQFSQEVQLVGKSDQFEYVVGGYYFNERVRDSRQTLFNILYTDSILATAVGTNPFTLPFPGQGFTSQAVKARSYAAFAQVTWSPNFADGRLHLTSGLRYTNDRKSFVRDLCGGVACNVVPEPFTESRFDPQFTIAYDVTPDINVYAKYAQAYRAGGVAVRSPTFRPFGPETNKSIEAGFKSDLLERRLRLNIAAYHQWLRNVQNSVIIDPADPIAVDTINTPGYNLWGIETEMTFVPTRGLSFSLAYAYQNGPGGYRIASDPFATYFVQNYPEHQLMAAVDWALPAQSFGQFAIHADYARASKYRGTPRVVDADLNPLVERNVANARLTLEDIPLGATKLRLSGFVKNLFDKAYPTAVASQRQVVLTEPRTYGLELGVKF